MQNEEFTLGGRGHFPPATSHFYQSLQQFLLHWENNVGQASCLPLGEADESLAPRRSPGRQDARPTFPDSPRTLQNLLNDWYFLNFASIAVVAFGWAMF